MSNAIGFRFARLGVACGLLIALLHAAPVQATEHTNVVIIYADDLGYGDLGCYGHPKFQTPRIDQLAREGARLTNFYSCCPYCAPSRAGLMTGRYQFRNRMYQNPFPSSDPQVKNGDRIGLPTSEVTLGEAFQSAGYRTGCIGKWHLGHQPEFRPLRNGFDEYFGILYSNDMHPVQLFDGNHMIEYPVFQPTLTRRYTVRAIKFLEEHQDRPFFLYLPHAMPHKPLAASEEFYEKSGAGLYGDAMAELDWSVGQIVDALKDFGLDRNTLLLFSSDNGPWYGGSTGGLRGMKGQTWEGGIRVPLIARWPGKIPSSRVIHEPAIIMDLFATSLAAAGVESPADRVIDGRNLLPMLSGDKKSPHDVLFSIRNEQLCTVRGGKWKLHLAAPGPANERMWQADEKWIDPRRPDGVRIIAPFEQAHPSDFPGVQTGDKVSGIALFDLEADPGEQHNVAEQHPEVVNQLKAHADRVKTSFGNP